MFLINSFFGPYDGGSCFIAYRIHIYIYILYIIYSYHGSLSHLKARCSLYILHVVIRAAFGGMK